ncbi:Integral membrane protein TerC [Nitrosomonas eutropha C91]|uniref:Integral membrane protein TerC n=2 Tax=Nitrosomonas eutropha TaxID=916 RepID=Q0AE79_NITEC|nr:Integral membrane protein TerC [Nitrosomonas eutropha C91]
MMGMADPQFWVAVFQIIAIDIALGADNAVIIALACRNLPENKRNQGIFWGMVGAIGIRVLLVFFALQLLALPYLKIIGAFLLLWISVKLLLPEPGASESGPIVKGGGATLPSVIKTIIVADTVMSLDNVMGIAGAARDSLALVIFGLLFSVPIIVWGSKLVMKWIERFPVIVVVGAGLLGWIAGGLLTTDTVSQEWVDTQAAYLHWLAPLSCSLLVIGIGKWLAARIHKSMGVSVDLLGKD